jgi:hypothetical protein
MACAHVPIRSVVERPKQCDASEKRLSCKAPRDPPRTAGCDFSQLPNQVSESGTLPRRKRRNEISSNRRKVFAELPLL